MIFKSSNQMRLLENSRKLRKHCLTKSFKLKKGGKTLKIKKKPGRSLKLKLSREKM